ncbi:MAG: magnesium transporter [Kosmotogales bacterium]|nr:magnesium transporter [Kosmotogales bacterium]
MEEVIEMIKYFQTEEGVLKRVDEAKKKCWIYVEKPQEDEINLLKSMNIEEDFIYDSLDPDERSRFEKDEDIIYVIFRIPLFDNEDSDVPYKSIPMGIVITSDAFITIVSQQNDILNDFLSMKTRNFSTNKHNQFLLKIIERATLYYLKYLKEIKRISDEIQNQLHGTPKNEEIIRLLNYEKSLVYFKTSLTTNDIMFGKLQRAEILALFEEDEWLFEDIIIDNKQAIEMSKIYSEILTVMLETFSSVISNNLNLVMKILTIVTLILQIPTLVASIYGMNIVLPMQNSPFAFIITMSISFATAVILGFVLFKGRWFK